VQQLGMKIAEGDRNAAPVLCYPLDTRRVLILAAAVGYTLPQDRISSVMSSAPGGKFQDVPTSFLTVSSSLLMSMGEWMYRSTFS
jgi:hypothetical protein